ncbi:MAG: 2'-5' RNA ligase family protein [Anaeroplasmataceae bacterium]|nr:2'-5' RNA ligase family protein [Anaeroplasmataceae bacterium]
MKKDKFLTVYAVLDEETQKTLTHLQNEILNAFPNGTQTMDIPFHISLGSFPVEMEEELVERMRNLSYHSNPSPIELMGMDHFNHQVIFVKPTLTEDLKTLHQAFLGNYSDGFPWVPHITLYCGKEEEGKEILKQFSFSKASAKIVGLEIGEFFPTRIIENFKF